MKIWKKYNYLAICALCTAVVISIIYYFQKVSPFGDNSLLTIDFFHQYGPMLGELWDRITGGSNLIYSFNMGLGLPLFRNFFNYLSSPFNILLFLFNRNNLLTSYSIIIGLKVVVSSLTMCYFLSKKVDNKYLAIPLSLLYTFCAYFGAYYWNIMWLDGLVMLPLITLSIEKLIEKDTSLLYIFSLAIMLFANYFIGYMICIFSLLYFITYLIIKTDKLDNVIIFKKCMLFVISSLLAGGLCAFFLIPLFEGLHTISATKDTIPFSQYYAFSFKDFIFNHLSGVGSSVFKSDITNAPNISVGIIPVILVGFFVVNSKINLKTKICYMLLLIFMFLSFIFAPLDFVWHAFHVPNDLPYRYSFIYSFIIILISAISLNKIKDVKKWLGTIIYVLTIIFIYLTKELTFLNITREMITLNYALASIFYIGFMLNRFNKLKYPIICIITISCMGEIAYTINNNWHIDQNIMNFYSDYAETKDLLENVKSNDENFYRIERDSMLTFNDPSWYNYYGMTTFSSMEYESNALLLHSLGSPSNEINSFYYKNNTPIYNTLFALNYIISNTELNNYDKFINGTDSSVYRSIYKGNLMYAVNNDIKNYVSDYSPFVNQNNLIESMTNVSDVLTPMNILKSQTVFEDDEHRIIKYYIKNNFDNIYIYSNNYDIDFILFNDKFYYQGNDYEYADEYVDNIWQYVDYNENFIISDKLNDNLIEIYVGYNYFGDDFDEKGFDIYQIDYDKWNSAYKILNNDILKIVKFEENEIIVSTSLNDNKSIYSSIPYDKGWKVYVDEKEVTTYEIAGALLGFDVDSGEHEIKLRYSIPYIGISILISCMSLIITIVLGIFMRRRNF